MKEEEEEEEEEEHKDEEESSHTNFPIYEHIFTLIFSHREAS